MLQEQLEKIYKSAKPDCTYEINYDNTKVKVIYKRGLRNCTATYVSTQNCHVIEMDSEILKMNIKTHNILLAHELGHVINGDCKHHNISLPISSGHNKLLLWSGKVTDTERMADETAQDLLGFTADEFLNACTEFICKCGGNQSGFALMEAKLRANNLRHRHKAA